MHTLFSTYSKRIFPIIRSILRFIRKKLLIVIPVFLLICAVFIYFFIFYNLPTPNSLKNFKVTQLSTHIMDRNGKLLYEIYREQNRTPVKLKSLPPYVYQASVAVEDKDFYRHQGVSLISGIFRAIKDMVLKHNLQGGSTITQQLVKSALLTPERTVRRKIKEIVLAIWTEKIFSKDEILEMYVNQVPYGGSSYGIEEAAKTYFATSAAELTIDQAALLAGLPQAPSYYSPHVNPDLSVSRRNEVLKKMGEQKYITEEEKIKALDTKLIVTPPKTIIKAPHFVFYVKSQLENIYGIKEVEEGGMKVITTLDLDIQEESEKILKEELEEIEALNVTNGAVLVTRPPTGEILAMVGSVNYFATASGTFNVTTALRQPGSSIKPLNYAVGIDRRLVTAGTVFLDIPTCFSGLGQPKGYCPVNYDGTFHGPTQLRFALGNSYNIPAVKMIAINGVTNFIASASGFTISTFKDPSNYGLSLTLGGGEVRMTEMAQAFSTFANRGKPRKLNAILKIENSVGKIIFENKDPNIVKNVRLPVQNPNFLAIPGKNVLSPETTFIISHILLDDNARSQAFGAGSLLTIPGKAVSVKTGTTDDKKDNWTIGYTPNFLTVVWVGNNDNTPMNPYLASGVTGAAPIWNKVMKFTLQKQPDLWPMKPETVIGKQICTISGLAMTKDGGGAESCPARFEYFIAGTEPKDPEVLKQMVSVTKDDKLAQPGAPDTEIKEKQIIKDMFSSYCLDCNNDGKIYTTIRL